MARTIRTMHQTLIVPEGSHERFLPVQDACCQSLRDINVQMAGISDLADGFVCERREASIHLLLYTIEGEGSLRFVKNATRLRSGDLLIAPAGSRYAYATAIAHWKMVWFHLWEREPWGRLCHVGPHVRDALLQHELHTTAECLLAESFRQEAGSKRLVELCAEQLALYLERELASEDTERDRRKRQKLHDLWNHVNAHLGRAWTVEALAERLCVAPSHFHRVCQLYAGHAPMQMVFLLRMRRAEELLLNYDYGINLIANQLGYSTPFTFSSAFKRYKGISPKHYRARKG